MKNRESSRRDFLKFTGAGLLSTLLPWDLLEAKEMHGNGKRLILLSLRGGCDTLSAFVPYTDSLYSPHFRNNTAINLDTLLKVKDFEIGNDAKNADVGDKKLELGFNSRFKNLQRIWDEGNMALFPATHCGDNANTSHFYQYGFYDRGGYNNPDGAIFGKDGWLSSYCNAMDIDKSCVCAYNFATDRNMFYGANPPAFSSKTPYHLSSISSKTKEDLEEMYTKSERVCIAKKVEIAQMNFFKQANLIADLELPQKEFLNGKEVLGLHKEAIYTKKIFDGIDSISVVQLEQTGYDTHSSQRNRLEGTGKDIGLFGELDETIGYLYDSYTDDLANTLIIVHTEFGRTIDEDGASEGTDHGQAAAWFAIGGAVKGGMAKDSWKGLDSGVIEDGGRSYLKQTTDYRDILTQALAWLGMADPYNSLDGYTQEQYENAIDYLDS